MDKNYWRKYMGMAGKFNDLRNDSLCRAARALMWEKGLHDDLSSCFTAEMPHGGAAILTCLYDCADAWLTFCEAAEMDAVEILKRLYPHARNPYTREMLKQEVARMESK